MPIPNTTHIKASPPRNLVKSYRDIGFFSQSVSCSLMRLDNVLLLKQYNLSWNSGLNILPRTPLWKKKENPQRCASLKMSGYLKTRSKYSLSLSLSLNYPSSRSNKIFMKSETQLISLVSSEY